MGRLFADFDWIAHPLGPPQSWPAEVRSAVAVVLTSRFPIVLVSITAEATALSRCNRRSLSTRSVVSKDGQKIP